MRGHVQLWWHALLSADAAGRLVLARDGGPGFTRFLAAAVALLYAAYGATMGLYRCDAAAGFIPATLPAVASALKLPLLFLAALAICFPLLYSLNALMGPRLPARGALRLLLLALSANAVALASYAPFSIFFTLTTSRAGYEFLIVMHVVVFVLAGAASLGVILMACRGASRLRGLSLSMAFVAGWGAVYGLVGTQVAWTLRPWIGTWDLPYRVIRPIEGSFYETLWRILASG